MMNRGPTHKSGQKDKLALNRNIFDSLTYVCVSFI